MNRTHQTNVRLIPKTRISACLSLPRGAFTLWEGFFLVNSELLSSISPVSSDQSSTLLALANSII